MATEDDTARWNEIDELDPEENEANAVSGSKPSDAESITPRVVDEANATPVCKPGWYVDPRDSNRQWYWNGEKYGKTKLAPKQMNEESSMSKFSRWWNGVEDTKKTTRDTIDIKPPPKVVNKPGWYVDPRDSNRQWYWNGDKYTKTKLSSEKRDRKKRDRHVPLKIRLKATSWITRVTIGLCAYFLLALVLADASAPEVYSGDSTFAGHLATWLVVLAPFLIVVVIPVLLAGGFVVAAIYGALKDHLGRAGREKREQERVTAQAAGFETHRQMKWQTRRALRMEQARRSSGQQPRPILSEKRVRGDDELDSWAKDNLTGHSNQEHEAELAGAAVDVTKEAVDDSASKLEVICAFCSRCGTSMLFDPHSIETYCGRCGKLNATPDPSEHKADWADQKAYDHEQECLRCESAVVFQRGRFQTYCSKCGMLNAKRDD